MTRNRFLEKLSSLSRIGVVFVVLFLPATASAVAYNLGKDVNNDGSIDDVSFYDGSNDGETLNGKLIGKAETFEITFSYSELAAVFGEIGEISQVLLFVDATDLGVDDLGRLSINGGSDLTLFNNSPSSFGSCTMNAESCIPVETGGVSNAPGGDVDNSFFDITETFLDILTAQTSLSLSFRNAALTGLSSFRLDGVNLAATTGSATVTPEPGTLLLLGSGLVGLGLSRLRAQRRDRVAIRP